MASGRRSDHRVLTVRPWRDVGGEHTRPLASPRSGRFADQNRRHCRGRVGKETYCDSRERPSVLYVISSRKAKERASFSMYVSKVMEK